ncbi:hypothetical protein STEG23_025881, partial [Scotinomys teguina]
PPDMPVLFTQGTNDASEFPNPPAHGGRYPYILSWPDWLLVQIHRIALVEQSRLSTQGPAAYGKEDLIWDYCKAYLPKGDTTHSDLGPPTSSINAYGPIDRGNSSAEVPSSQIGPGLHPVDKTNKTGNRRKMPSMSYTAGSCDKKMKIRSFI